MASRYDPRKKCRVGTMDEAQFYAETGKATGAFFRTLLAAWRDAGGSVHWGAGGAGLRREVGGKDVALCFLAPAFAGKKDRIELCFTPLAKQIGKAPCKGLEADLRKAAGDRFRGSTMVSILEPGTLDVASQKAIAAALLRAS
jgi:hypothetical protein